MRIALLALLAATVVWAQTSRLWLKDGTYQMVRQYEVKEDRVRYYSTERGDWEEIPVEMVDLKKTQQENAEFESKRIQDAKEQDEEDKAVRAERKEIASIPIEPGAYYIHGDKLDTIHPANVKIVNDKKRSVLKVLSPVPLVPGKQTVELDGESAAFKVTEDRPEFYFRLSDVLAFAIVKLEKKKGARLVETVSVQPVTNEMIEDRKVVATFKKQVNEQLFKIWPEEKMEPGEYALIQYLEGQVNPQVWDFTVQPNPQSRR